MMWQKQLTNLIQQIESELSFLEKDIVTRTKERDDLFVEYQETQKELSEAAKAFDSFDKESKKITLKQEAREQELKAKEIKLDEDKKKVELEIENATNKLQSIEREIAVKNSELTSIEIKQKQIQSLEQELGKLTVLVQLRAGEVSLLEKNITELKKESEQKKELFLKENSEAIKELAEEKVKLSKERIRLEEKEVTLNKKEQDLSIVEKRYRKLYEEKGASFKI